MSKSFLQTNKWCEFQKALGADCFNVGDVLFIKYKLPFGKSYLYIPRSNINSSDLNKIISFSGNNNVIFLRIEPQIEDKDKEFIKNLQKLGFKKSSHESMPSRTQILNIDKPEKELLANMHQKTRYNIRLAEKKGIKIGVVDKLSDKEFDRVWSLIQSTAKRDKFSSFSKKYYKNLLETFRVLYIKIVLAKHEDRIIATAIIMFYGDMATYLHGASDYEYRNLMAPYLVQWSAIREARKIGCTFYDFWGTSEKKWPGVTRFKKGFGGREVECIGTYDLIFSPIWYRIYLLSKKIKRWIKF